MAGFPETYTYTGDQLGLQVKQKFGDTGSVQITDPMLLGWINNGARQIAQQNPFIEGIAQTGLIAGQNVYDLVALFTTQKMAEIVQIVLNGKSLDLIPFSEFQAVIINDQAFVGGVAQGVPVSRPTVGSIFAQKLNLWPTPGITLANGISIYYKAYPADLAVITGKITVPDRFYNALFDYVMAQALELDENFSASQIKLSHFQDDVRREWDRENFSPTDFYSGMMMDPYDDDAVYNPGAL